MHWPDRVLFGALAVVTLFMAGFYFDAQEIFYFPHDPFDFEQHPVKYIAYDCACAA